MGKEGQATPSSPEERRCTARSPVTVVCMRALGSFAAPPLPPIGQR